MKRFIIQILTLMLLFSCNREEGLQPGNGQPGILSISAQLPELEVRSKSVIAAQPTIYAYLSNELNASILNPLPASLSNGNIYHYEIPEGSQNILFSNLRKEKSGRLSLTTSLDGLMDIRLQDSSLHGTQQDVLFGYISDVQSGNDKAYQVNFKRMVAKLKVQLNLVIDNDTINQVTGILESAKVDINGFCNHLMIDANGLPQYSGEAMLAFPLTADINNEFTADSILTFPSAGNSHELNLSIIQANGIERSFKASVNQSLEANKYYTLSLYLKKNNADVEFTLSDIIVKQTTITDYNKDQSSLLNVSSSNIFLQKETGNAKKIAVTTRLNKWEAEITEGSEWLAIDTTSGINGDSLQFSTLSENTGSFRIGKVTISSEQYKQEIMVQQSNGELQTIILDVTGNGGRCYINIAGENFTIDYGNGEGPQGPYTYSENNIRNFNKSNCGTITISGENLSYFNNSSYNYIDHITLNHCYSLKTLKVYGLKDNELDFSKAPHLKELDCSNGQQTNIKLEGNPLLEKLTCRSCPNIATLNVNAIASTLKELDCGDCDQLNMLEIYPDGFSGKRILEKLNVEYCDILAGVNVSNYENLKELNSSGCSKLEALVAQNCSSLQTFNILNCDLLSMLNLKGCSVLKNLNIRDLRKLTNLYTDGCSNLETIDCNNCTSLNNINFTNYTNLKKVNCRSCAKATEFIFKGCNNLTEIDLVYNQPEKIDFRGCVNLPSLAIDCYNTTELLLDSCLSLKNLEITNPYMTSFDPSVCPALESLYWSNSNNRGNVTQLNLSLNSNLKSLRINYENKLEGIDLSGCAQLEKIDLSRCYQLQNLILGGQNTLKEFVCKGYEYGENNGFLFTDLDLSNYTQLTSITLQYLQNTTNVNLSGCTSLESYNGANNAKITTINIAGCNALKMFNCNTNPGISSLDFSGCKTLTEVDCRYCTLSAEGLNTMFTSLPDLTSNVNIGKIKVTGNPGADACNQSIVLDKNWYFPNN